MKICEIADLLEEAASIFGKNLSEKCIDAVRTLREQPVECPHRCLLEDSMKVALEIAGDLNPESMSSDEEELLHHANRIRIALDRPCRYPSSFDSWELNKDEIIFEDRLIAVPAGYRVMVLKNGKKS